MGSLSTKHRPYFWTSTGKKFLMAVSGLALVGFIVGHLIGNLQMFLGQEAVNRYAAFLKSTGELLWVARLGLIAMVLTHIVTAVSLALENAAARPVGYAAKTYKEATYASRTMKVSGLVVLAFLGYHLAHFTLLVTHPEYHHLLDDQGRHDVYSMVVMGFQVPWISGFYILGTFLLGMHLTHGIYSMFQSLGFQTIILRKRIRPAAIAAGWLLFLGFASIPLGVLAGLIQLPSGGLVP
ncbi:MAG: succinate dehydrogenase cytochrome b subunit [Elusimicrobia bacterium]|nr:succinate dehydrogenase cytochrome b subunit [Elusimicrobiota bacterium]